MLKDVASLYGMSGNTLHMWLTRYASPDYHPITNRSYKPSEKRSVLRAVESGMSINEAATVFGISSGMVIRGWMKKASAENADLSVIVPMKKPDKENLNPPDIKALERQLAEAQLKIRALETMIDIAEEQLKIDIRKKSGARQSPK
jgi:transposase-like protein